MGWTGSTFNTTRDIVTYETVFSGNLGSSVYAYRVVEAPAGCQPFGSPDVTLRTNLDGVTISDGRATGTFTTGGGIYVRPHSSGSIFTEPVFRNCIIEKNYAQQYGGGVLADYTDDTHYTLPTFRNCTFMSNESDGSGGAAGGEYKCVMTFVNCTFDGNSARSSGGAISADRGSSFKVYNCKFTNNIAEGFSGSGGNGKGGAIHMLGWVDPANPIVVNSLFIGNEAQTSGYGGAMYINTATATLKVINCTFSANEADTGGGFYLEDGIAEIRSSILWDDVATTNPEYTVLSGTLTISHSNIEGNGNSGTNIDQLPNFDSDYRLVCNSRGINEGGNTYVLADAEDVNEDGNHTEDVPDRDLQTRKVGTVDMGAYETQWDRCNADISGATVGQPDGDVGVPDLLRVINLWGPCTSCGINDFAPLPCGGDGTIGVGELLAIINNWGADCASQDGGTAPATITDCFEVYCVGLSGAEWEECIEKCVEAVCAENPSECE